MKKLGKCRIVSLSGFRNQDRESESDTIFLTMECFYKDFAMVRLFVKWSSFLYYLLCKQLCGFHCGMRYFNQSIDFKKASFLYHLNYHKEKIEAMKMKIELVSDFYSDVQLIFEITCTSNCKLISSDGIVIHNFHIIS